MLSMTLVGMLALVGAGCGDDAESTDTTTVNGTSAEEVLEDAEKDVDEAMDKAEMEAEEVLDEIEEDLDQLEEEVDEAVDGEEASEELTLDTVAEHGSEDDCWLVVEGTVYDVTEYITSHPGGSAILQGCGTDATEMFNSRPGSGTSHSETARAMLPDYEVGPLAE